MTRTTTIDATIQRLCVASNSASDNASHKQEHTDAEGGWEIKVNISPLDARAISRLGGKNALQIQQQLLAESPLEA